MKRAIAIARRVLRASFLAACACLALGWIVFEGVHDDLVDESLFARPLDSAIVTDRDGEPLRHHLPDGIDRRWATLDTIGPDVVDAFLACEDARFYEHGAFDVAATLRAVVVDVVPGGRVSGASTITQQVVKLVYGRPHGLLEKPLEIARAIELERRFTKDEILEQYLNRVPMGNGIVGVERASWAYFGRPTRELSLAEAAVLAGIPQAPSITEPRRHLARALRRRDYVLDRLETLGWADAERITRARAETLAVVATAPRPYRAPRFVDRALVARRREARTSPELTTSLSLALTTEADTIVETGAHALTHRGATNGAAIVVANATGEILAYVGAADDEAEGGALDLLSSPRQPGSTLKPFAYALFFASGATPATPVDDLRRPMTGRGGSLYVGTDFDGRERGPVSARLALASSLNLAALDVVTRVGPDRFVDGLDALGFSHAEAADRESAAVVLGGVDVTAMELARAYVTLARGGDAIPLTMWRTSDAPASTPVLDGASARLVTDVLSDAAARRAGFGRDLEREAGDEPFALKTGTSSGFHDAWTAAYDDDFTVVVWLGDPSGEPMEEVTGFEGAAPLAARILGAARRRRSTLLEPLAPTQAPRVALASVEVCAHTGLLPGPHCHHIVRERFPADAIPTSRCAAHDETGALLLPARYADWIRRARPPGVALETEPHRETTVARVAYPRDGATLLTPSLAEPPTIPLRAVDGDAPIGDVTFELDGVRLATASWRMVPGHHRITPVVRGRRGEESEFDVVTR
jgi:penicillin-binding protein 1C